MDVNFSKVKNEVEEEIEDVDLNELYRIVPQKPCTKRFLHITDQFLSMFLITPLVIANWRGTWGLMDDHKHQFPAINSFFFGLVLHTTLAFARHYLHKEFTMERRSRFKTILIFFTIKFYTYVFSIACIMHWRGGWAIMEQIFGTEIWSSFIPSTFCIVCLVLLRAMRNMLAPPVVVLTDTKYFTFAFPMRFRKEGAREPGLYVLDCVFSVVVVGTLVVLAWRGIWAMVDLKLYPDNPVYSSWGSLILGYGIVTITFAIQPLVRWICDRVNGKWRIATADLFLFFSFIGTVNVWRGVWHLLDLYFLPDNRVLSLWLSHGIGFVLLALLNCSNSVLVRGVYIDAEEPAGQCVVFPIYYIRLFFQRERQRKQKQLLDSLEKQDQNNTMYLLEKSGSTAQNSIKIVKNNTHMHNKQSSETKPMISRTNEKSQNGEHAILKDKESY